jgi:serine/threonine protein kinase
MPTEFDGLSVLRLIGENSIASAYLARETKPERLVVLKVLKEVSATNTATLACFEREALDAARIVHPNVATIYRFGKRKDGLPYFLQEYVGTHSVAKILCSEDSRTIDDSIRTIASLAKALEAAHAKGIVHSNVRPENILVERDSGRIVLTNFGIAGQAARIEEGLSDSRYVSPEQRHGDSATSASDIFSLGVLANELLDDGAPEELAQLLRKCIGSNPNSRPTASELALHLTRDERIEAPQDLEQPTQRAAESVMMRAAVVGGIVIMAIGAAVAYWLYEHYRQ